MVILFFGSSLYPKCGPLEQKRANTAVKQAILHHADKCLENVKSSTIMILLFTHSLKNLSANINLPTSFIWNLSFWSIFCMLRQTTKEMQTRKRTACSHSCKAGTFIGMCCWSFILQTISCDTSKPQPNFKICSHQSDSKKTCQYMKMLLRAVFGEVPACHKKKTKKNSKSFKGIQQLCVQCFGSVVHPGQKLLKHWIHIFSGLKIKNIKVEYCESIKIILKFQNCDMSQHFSLCSEF